MDSIIAVSTRWASPPDDIRCQRPTRVPATALMPDTGSGQATPDRNGMPSA